MHRILSFLPYLYAGSVVSYDTEILADTLASAPFRNRRLQKMDSIIT